MTWQPPSALPDLRRVGIIGLEQWRDIPSYEGSYQVSDLGRVRSVPRKQTLVNAKGDVYTRTYHGKILKPAPTSSGHLTVVLGRAGGSQHVHALVLKAFVGAAPQGRETRHIDGNEKNNCLSNLEYATRTRNSQDKKWHNGAANYVLKPTDVIDIKRRLGPRGMGVALAREYRVSPTTISNINRGRIHKDCVS
jgi:hypothetical protein